MKRDSGLTRTSTSLLPFDHHPLFNYFPTVNRRAPHPNSHLPVTREMHRQSGPAHFQMLFDLFAASLQRYEEQTGITLSKHPLAEQLRYSNSVESITAILQGLLPACSGSGGTDRIMKSLSSIVSVLYTPSFAVDLYWVCSKALIGLSHSSHP